jgi:hypothetical protein
MRLWDELLYVVKCEVSETYSPRVGALAYAAVYQLAIIYAIDRCIVDVVQAYLYQPYPEDAMPLYLATYVAWCAE